MGFPVAQNPPANAGDSGDAGMISGSGKSCGEGNGKPLRYSCLGNPMDRGDWWAVVHQAAEESDMTYQLNNNKVLITTLCCCS